MIADTSAQQVWTRPAEIVALRERRRFIRCKLRTLALLLPLLGWAASARAHGEPPQVYGVAAALEGRPSVVILNEGLALRGPDNGWSYLCPALWGDSDAIRGGRTKAQSRDGKTTWIIGDDVYAFDGRRFVAQRQMLLRELGTTVLAGDAGGLFALHFGALGHEIVPVGTGAYQPIWSPGSYWSTLAVDAQRLYVGRVSDLQLDVTQLDRAGTEQQTVQIALETEASGVRLAPLSQGLFAVLDENAQKRIGRLEAGRFVPLATAAHSMLGPVASPNGGAWIAIDGRLQPLPNAAQGPTAETDAGCLDLERRSAAQCISCLGELDGMAYACSATELYRLDDAGLGERIFDLRGLRPPPAGLISDPAFDLCQSQWNVFEADLRTNGLLPQRGNGPIAGTGGAPSVQMTTPVVGAGDMEMPPHTLQNVASCTAAVRTPALTAPALPIALVLAGALWRRRRLALRRARMSEAPAHSTTRCRFRPARIPFAHT